jgi:RNA polymerase sigma-70 factor, ECF subfamily
MASIAMRDASAFRSLVELYRDRLFRLAKALAPSEALAEEILQQTFLSVYENAGTYRGESSLKTWLFTILRHAAYRQRQKLGKVLEAEAEADLSDLVAHGVLAGWGSESPEELAMAHESAHRLEAALGWLEPEYREVLVLRDLEQVSGEDVASLLGLSLTAMKSRLHRARLRLSAELRKEVVRGPRT